MDEQIERINRKNKPRVKQIRSKAIGITCYYCLSFKTTISILVHPVAALSPLY